MFKIQILRAGGGRVGNVLVLYDEYLYLIPRTQIKMLDMVMVMSNYSVGEVKTGRFMELPYQTLFPNWSYLG